MLVNYTFTFQQQKAAETSVGYRESSVLVTPEDFHEPKRKRFKKDAYFSDEEEIDDGNNDDDADNT